MPEETHNKHKKVHDFLHHHPVGVLSTVSPDGTPWGAAVYYIVDEDFNFFFVTRTKTIKYQNLDKNPFAAFTIADGPTQTTVQVSGKISKVPIQDYVDIYFDKFAKIRPEGNPDWTPPLSRLHMGNYMPFRLTPTRLHYADYGHIESDDHTDSIEKIIPA